MNDWFKATAENYFGRVSKPGIIEALKEAAVKITCGSLSYCVGLNSDRYRVYIKVDQWGRSASELSQISISP
jgi:hypothetical protein